MQPDTETELATLIAQAREMAGIGPLYDDEEVSSELGEYAYEIECEANDHHERWTGGDGCYSDKLERDEADRKASAARDLEKRIDRLMDDLRRPILMAAE